MIVKPLAVKFDNVVTLAPALCEIAPPAVTVRLLAVISPRSTAPASTMVMSVPFAVRVPKLFVGTDIMMAFPVATRLDVPVTSTSVPRIWLIFPPADVILKLVAEILPRIVELLL